MQEYYKINSAPTKKGLYSLLEFLSSTGCKMAVASSSPRWEVEKHLADAKITAYFDVVVCGDMINKSKLDPKIYFKAYKLLERNPEECYALEDSKNGLLAAYRAGCKPIMIPDLWQADEKIEKILYAKFESLEEVKNYFSNLVNYKR